MVYFKTFLDLEANMMFTFLPERITLCLSAMILLSLGAQAQAIPPIILHEFKFDANASTLGVTGGFAGINDTYGIDGSLGLAIGYDQVFDGPGQISLVPFAMFTEVDAVLTGPPGLLGGPGWLAGTSLDSHLNLTGLEGTVLQSLTGTELVFNGVDGGGQPMSVHASLKNGRLGLKGQNFAGCCDFFNYRLDATLDSPLKGDLNHDGFVGIDDLNTVLANFGNSVPPMLHGDSDWDGYIGITDLNAVLANWNTGPGAPASVVVPEPVILGLLLPGLTCWMMRRRA